VVPFESGDSVSGHAFRRATEAVRQTALAAVTAGSQRLKPFSLLCALAASLKRSPDTESPLSNCTSIRSKVRLAALAHTMHFLASRIAATRYDSRVQNRCGN